MTKRTDSRGYSDPKVFASSRSECLRIARPKAGLFVVIPMRQAGLPAPTSEQNKAWGPDAMDRSATPSIAIAQVTLILPAYPTRFGSASRQRHVASTSKAFCLNAFCCDWLIRDCKRTLSPFHRRVVTTYALELGAAGDGDNRDHTFSAFRAPRYSIHEILPITAN